MKTLIQHIQEAFRVNQDYKPEKYTCQPKDKDELKEIIKDRLKEDPNANMNDIDVSEITDMSQLFYPLRPHKIDISEWNVSKVTNMDFMFYECRRFNADLSKWDVSKVTQMNSMFDNCSDFEGKGLENWDVSKVTQMESMFDCCDRFNCDLNKWDVSNVENMKFMFYNCLSLKNKPKWYKS